MTFTYASPHTEAELRGNLARMDRSTLLRCTRAWGITAHRLQDDAKLRDLLVRLARRAGRIQ